MVQKKLFSYGTIELGEGDTNFAKFLEESVGLNPNDILYNDGNQRNLAELQGMSIQGTSLAELQSHSQD